MLIKRKYVIHDKETIRRKNHNFSYNIIYFDAWRENRNFYYYIYVSLDVRNRNDKFVGVDNNVYSYDISSNKITAMKHQINHYFQGLTYNNEFHRKSIFYFINHGNISDIFHRVKYSERIKTVDIRKIASLMLSSISNQQNNIPIYED